MASTTGTASTVASPTAVGYAPFEGVPAAAAFLNAHLPSGRTRFLYEIPPGKALHPAAHGYTAQALGESQAAFDMQNRAVESGACHVAPDSVVGIQEFDGAGLSLDPYQGELQTNILPDACKAFPDTTAVIDVIWKDDHHIWNAEATSRLSRPVEKWTTRAG